MAKTIDLREFENGCVVVHFGGRLHEVDAVTFGNAMAAALSIGTVSNN